MKQMLDGIKVIRYSLNFFWKNDRLFLLIKLLKVVLDVINGFLLVILPGYIIDSLSIFNNTKMAITYVIVFLISTIIHSLFSGIISKELSIRKIKLNYVLYQELLTSTSSIDYETFESAQTLDDFELAKKTLLDSHILGAVDHIFALVKNILSICSYFYIVFKYSLIFVPLATMIIITNAFYKNKQEQLYMNIQKDSASLDRKITYASSSLLDYDFAKEIRLFNLKDFIFEKYNYYMQKMYGLEYKYIKKILPLQLTVTLLGAIQIFVCYGSLSYSLHIGEISTGMFVQYSSAYFALSTAITSVVSSSIMLKSKWAYISAYENFLRKTNIIFFSKRQKNNIHRKDFSTIEFRNVSFKYPSSEKYVLKNINITINANDKIAIVGSNGAGKTTFIKILLGLYKPTSGDVLIDGSSIYDMNFSDYMDYFSAVFQDCSTLNYSIAENIAFSEMFDADRMEKILSIVQLKNKMESLSNGLDTFITRDLDENGSDLSGGEKQKIIISRALYKNSPIYVFDEPTSALSANGEYELYKSFSSFTKSKTVFYISHRLAVCKLCDRVIVFDEGKIIDDGSYEDLSNKQCLFKQMFNAQAEYYK